MTGKTYDFILKDDHNNDFKLIEHLPAIIYFYPKDNSTGCTAEACEFSARKNDFLNLGYHVIGISKDTVQQHQQFKQKHQLNLTLLSDPEKIVCHLFDVIKPKKLYGKEYLGIERSTFILNAQGEIQKEYRKVKAKGHAKQVLDELKNQIES